MIAKCEQVHRNLFFLNFVLLRQAAENALEKNMPYILSNTRILKESKKLAFFWRWPSDGKLCFKMNAI
jgi:hypothetical protein